MQGEAVCYALVACKHSSGEQLRTAAVQLQNDLTRTR